MRIVIQRVKRASVKVEDKIVGQIEEGALVLFGSHKNDLEKQIPWLANKLINLRMFHDENEKMNLSLLDIKGEVLIVPQFTLYADCIKGRRPSFTDAMEPKIAKTYFEKFTLEVKKHIPNVQTGVFAAVMEVDLLNFGPVTFIIDAK